ncbi:MAG: GDSL-type esterase/lipase family protein [Dysgonamonadaceae bacterium]|jgi:lysophospholipase L1-like esterase|nr:GDSL-type esterase/lipase family protein [Dysgonamonadaceae bacterium]
MKKLIPLAVLLLSCLCVRTAAQQTRTELHKAYISPYDFINDKYKDIRIPGGDSTRLNRFFQKIDTLVRYGEGTINILHIGGSHVQADMFSHQVRRNLDAVNAGHRTPRGFIFPFSVAKTNNPANYRVTYSGEWKTARNVQSNREIPLGVGGIAVYTSDPAARIDISLNTDSLLRWDFDQLRLLGYVQDNSDGVTPVLYYNNDTIEGNLDLISKTYLFRLPAPDYSFSIGFIRNDSLPHTFVVNGFLPEKETPGIVYHAIGVNGASVPSYLNSENFEEELHLLKPDLVVFAIGINDALSKDFSSESFRRNYNELIAKMERVNPEGAYIFITNNDSYRKVSRRKYAVNRNGLVARKVFYQLAEEHRGGVWDLFSLMGGLGSMRSWQRAGLARADKVHFRKSGYLLIGDLFYNALIDYYKPSVPGESL